MSNYLELTFEIFDEQEQRASVRESLTVGNMIEEIIKEFDDLDTGNLGSFALHLKGDDKPLEGSKRLSDHGIQDGDILIFNWSRGQLIQRRKGFSTRLKAVLRDEGTGTLFPIEWQPAIIGRPDIDAAHNELLAANMEWLPNSRRVSRAHAQITEQGGDYYVEGLVTNNVTYVNGRLVPAGQKMRLQSGDKVGLGLSKISLIFIVKQFDTSATIA